MVIQVNNPFIEIKTTTIKRLKTVVTKRYFLPKVTVYGLLKIEESGSSAIRQRLGKIMRELGYSLDRIQRSTGKKSRKIIYGYSIKEISNHWDEEIKWKWFTI